MRSQLQAAEPDIGGATRTRLHALARAIAEQVADVAAALVPAIGIRGRRVKTSVCRAGLATTSVACFGIGRGRTGTTKRTTARSPRSGGSPRAAISAGCSSSARGAAGWPTTFMFTAARRDRRDRRRPLSARHRRGRDPRRGRQPHRDERERAGGRPREPRLDTLGALRPARPGGVPFLPGRWDRAAVRGSDLRHRRDPLVHRPGPDRSRSLRCAACTACSCREVGGSTTDPSSTDPTRCRSRAGTSGRRSSSWPSAVGFRMGAWETAPQPHLVSPLTGRGLIENVLTFAASRV